MSTPAIFPGEPGGERLQWLAWAYEKLAHADVCLDYARADDESFADAEAFEAVCADLGRVRLAARRLLEKHGALPAWEAR